MELIHRCTCRTDALPLLVYGTTQFVAGCLLSLVLPMTGKLVLPRVGGSVPLEWAWQFHVSFLVGTGLFAVLYVFLIRRFLSFRAQVLAQGMVLVAGGAFLAVGSFYQRIASWHPAEGLDKYLLMLNLELSCFALPCFVVATPAVLLQCWFTRTTSRERDDPYFLYAFHQFGFATGNWLYFRVIETTLGLSQQSWLWNLGYLGLAGLAVLCIALAWRLPVEVETVSPMPAPTLTRRLRWLVLAALPSGIALAVARIISSGVEQRGMNYWIAPLGVGAITLAAALPFIRWPIRWTGWPLIVTLGLWPILLVLLALSYVAGVMDSSLATLLFLLDTSLICIGLLVKDRPAASSLPEFYLLMMLGWLPWAILLE